MAPKLKCTITTLESEYQLEVEPKCYARELFNLVISTTGIREHWFFGLSFTNLDGEEDWLHLDKKISKQNISLKSPKFTFKVKYFPESVTDDVILLNTLRLLFKQVKSEILSEKVYCPSEKAVLLASYGVQVKFGDYEEEKYEQNYLANERILPQKIIAQHNISIEEWETKVSDFHKTYNGMAMEEAMTAYMKIAQELDMYGIAYFSVTDKTNKEVILGIDAMGINIYPKDNKLTPNITFPWSQISKVSKKQKKFVISLVDTKLPAYKVTPLKSALCKTIFYLAAGNNDLYKKKRLGDSLEVQQMKSQREMDRKARENERKALKREMEMRRKVEQARLELQEQYRTLEARMEERNKELEKATESIKRLEEQLRETQAVRDDLQKQQNELKEMLEKMEKDREMDAEEKEKLHTEIQSKQEEIEQVRLKVMEQEEETQRIQEEIAKTKKTLEEQAKLAQALPVINQSLLNDSSDSSDSSDDEGVPSIVVNHVDEEAYTTKKNDILKDLREDLNQTLVEGTETQEDKNYRENLLQGRDKFKTLREVRYGSTKRQIDHFENM